MDHTFNVFKTCPLKEGQKIRVEDSPIGGDWEVISVSPYKITLRCPVSGKELTKDRFLFFVEESQGKWPR